MLVSGSAPNIASASDAFAFGQKMPGVLKGIKTPMAIITSLMTQGLFQTLAKAPKALLDTITAVKPQRVLRRILAEHVMHIFYCNSVPQKPSDGRPGVPRWWTWKGTNG